MNDRSRNKDKAIERYCDKVKVGRGTLYVPKNSWSSKIQFKTTEGVWSLEYFSDGMEIRRIIV